MKFHAFHLTRLWTDEQVVLFGFAHGRVRYEPNATFLHSFRIFFGPAKIEILWTTGASLFRRQLQQILRKHS